MTSKNPIETALGKVQRLGFVKTSLLFFTLAFTFVGIVLCVAIQCIDKLGEIGLVLIKSLVALWAMIIIAVALLTAKYPSNLTKMAGVARNSVNSRRALREVVGELLEESDFARNRRRSDRSVSGLESDSITQESRASVPIIARPTREDL